MKIGTNEAISNKADEIIAFAKSLIGQATYGKGTGETSKKPPYVLSCATFMEFIFETCGVPLGTYNEDYMMQQGFFVERENLQKGDVVIFDSDKSTPLPNHVGLYMGDNQLIHMADPAQDLIISDMGPDSKPYYKEAYLMGRRVLPGFMPSDPPTIYDRIVEAAVGFFMRQDVTNDLVKTVFETNGIPITGDLLTIGVAVEKAELRKGDLVFFKNPSLVAIYIGDHRFVVKTSSSRITCRTLLADYYVKNYVGARRILNFEEALKNVLVDFGKDRESSAPALVLAKYMSTCLNALNEAVQAKQGVV